MADSKRISPVARQTMSTNYEKKVIIVGKTGNGKSSLGNTLLKRKAFTALKGFNAVTTECTLEANIGKISVVDTPGLFDTIETNGNVKKITSNALSIIKSLDICSVPHAFLFTLNGACRLTDEELSVIDVLTIIFGKKWTDHAIVVVTHIDNDDEESEFKKDWEDCEKLNEFVKECNGRICRIDNKHPQEKHVKGILNNIDEVSQKGTRPFSVCYSDCRKKILQNEEKLEDYNGMPTHLIIKEIGRNIEKKIEEEMLEQEKHRKKMEKIAKEKLAALEKERYTNIRNAAICGTTAVATAVVTCVVGPVKVAVAGVCFGGASVAVAIGYIWSYFVKVKV